MRYLICLLCLLVTPALADPQAWRSEWPMTDFGRTSVTDWDQIMSGGPPRDGIPALDAPLMIAAGAEAGLDVTEGVITVALAGQPARAYPLRYLMWHEIVNDSAGGRDFTVTWCPLCNSFPVFDRRTPAGVRRFGVTGKLRNSDMVMFDRETESWWQQATGTAIVGELTGQRLDLIPARMESWASFRAAYPDGLVMAEPAVSRPYGVNPYQGYDLSRQPFLYDGADPPHGIAPLARVVRVNDRAWPLERIAAAGRIAEAGVIIDWQAGLASALETATVGGGRDIGQVRVTDAAGNALPHDVMFAFAFHAFWPDGQWMLAR